MVFVKSDFKFLRFSYKIFFLTLFLFANISLQAGPITSFLFDVENTILQPEQDYKIENGRKIPLLKEISGKWVNHKGETEYFTYYLKLGAESLFRKAKLLKKEGHIKEGFSALTFMPQAKLNAVLSAIVVDNEPLIDLVSVAFGSEAIAAYSKLVRPSDSVFQYRKDLGIFTQEKNIKIWTKLKVGDLSELEKLSAGKVSGQMTSVMIDDRPEEVIDLQRDHVVKIQTFFKRDKKFWRNYSFFTKHPLDSPKQGLEAQNFLALLDAERQMLPTFELLLEDTKRTVTPNAYNKWTLLLGARQTLGLDFTHFNYLLADLAYKDHPDQDILVLGRDTDLFNTALETVKEALGLKSKTFYLEISRLVAKNESTRIPLILKTAGIDVDSILNGKRRLLIVDSNYHGSIPKAILTSLVPENDPKWREKVRFIRTWLFNPARTHRAPPEAFANYNEYLINGAFIDPSTHQERVGHDYMRLVAIYQENRPKRTIRSTEANESHVIMTKNSHPTEYRYAEVLHQSVREYYAEPVNQLLII